MESIKNEIRAIFESYHYSDNEMITALEDLKNWCEKSIENIKEYMQ